MNPDEKRNFEELKRRFDELYQDLEEVLRTLFPTNWLFKLPVIFTAARWYMTSTFAAYASGTAYALTTSAALLNFGTTDPSITITSPGKYLIYARVRLDYTGATFAANRTATLKVRRTNNTAADLTGASAAFMTQIITTQTYTAGIIALPVVVYETDNEDDTLQLWGSIDTGPTAGSIDAVQAELVAIRIV